MVLGVLRPMAPFRALGLHNLARVVNRAQFTPASLAARAYAGKPQPRAAAKPSGSESDAGASKSGNDVYKLSMVKGLNALLDGTFIPCLRRKRNFAFLLYQTGINKMAAAIQPLLDFNVPTQMSVTLPLSLEPMLLGEDGRLPLRSFSLRLIPGPDGSLDYDKIALEVRREGKRIGIFRHADYADFPPPPLYMQKLTTPEKSWRILAAYCQQAAVFRREREDKSRREMTARSNETTRPYGETLAGRAMSRREIGYKKGIKARIVERFNALLDGTWQPFCIVFSHTVSFALYNGGLSKVDALLPLASFRVGRGIRVTFPLSSLPQPGRVKLGLRLIPGPGGSLDHDKIALEVRHNGSLLGVARYADYPRVQPFASNLPYVTGNRHNHPEETWKVLAKFCQVAEALRCEREEEARRKAEGYAKYERRRLARLLQRSDHPSPTSQPSSTPSS